MQDAEIVTLCVCVCVLLQVCKLLRHIACTDMLQVSAKYAEINLRIYGPQVVTAAHTLSIHPTSKIAKENVEGNGNFIFVYTL
jgi:hypothetical protein